MKNGRLILRHSVLSFLFLVFFVLLNHPSIILIAQLGSVTWYPATGLVLALLLGISPGYALLVTFAGLLPGALFYHQPFTSFGQTIGNLGYAACYGFSAYVLRGPLRIDPGLRRRQDVVRYVFVTMTAALVAA